MDKDVLTLPACFYVLSEVADVGSVVQLNLKSFLTGKRFVLVQGNALHAWCDPPHVSVQKHRLGRNSAATAERLSGLNILAFHLISSSVEMFCFNAAIHLLLPVWGFSSNLNCSDKKRNIETIHSTYLNCLHRGVIDMQRRRDLLKSTPRFTVKWRDRCVRGATCRKTGVLTAFSFESTAFWHFSDWWSVFHEELHKIYLDETSNKTPTSLWIPTQKVWLFLLCL